MRKRTTTRAGIGALALAVTTAPAAAQGIPVHDTANYLQALATVQHTSQMIQQGTQVIQTAQRQLNAFQELTNVNAVATNLENTAVRNVLPGGTTNVGAMLTGNYAQLGALGSQAQAIQNGYAIAPSGSASVDTQYNQLLQQVTAPAATKMANGASILAIAQQRTAGLEQLRTALDTAQDPKQVMDLNARIAVEQAHLQNDMIKLQALKMSEEAQASANSAIAASSSAAASAATYQNNILR